MHCPLIKILKKLNILDEKKKLHENKLQSMTKKNLCFQGSFLKQKNARKVILMNVKKI